MAEGSVDTEVAAPVDEVWALVGDFGGVGALFPDLESFRLEGDDRIIGMYGMEIREHLVSRDDETRTLEYSVVDGVPLERHLARVSVAPSGDGSLVTWWYDVEPESMAPIFGDTYRNALGVLAARFA